MILAGPSGCGKTSWIASFIKYRQKLMDIDPAKICLYYSVWQPLYNELEDIVDFRKGIPSIEDIEALNEYSEIGGSLVVIDDQALSINKDIATIFTVTARHTRVSLVLLTQNLFSKQQYFRDVSLQASYFVIFKNPRDNSSIRHLANQLSPNNTKYVYEAYEHALKRPYSYLLIDLDQKTNDSTRLRSNIFPNEHPIIVYTPLRRS